MSSYLREAVRSGDGDVEILIEVDEVAGGAAQPYRGYGPMRGGGGGGDIPTKAFERGMQLIRTCAEQVAETVTSVADAVRPSEVEVEFGVKLSGELGALITKSGIEGHLHVTLKWGKKDA